MSNQGSGKTLAYGLPIVNYVLNAPPSSMDNTRPLIALVLAPTRELAMQVSTHLNALAGQIAPGQTPPRVSVGAIVGGIDSHKQNRIIKRGMDIMVATPGRLWDLMNEVSPCLESV